MPVDWDITKLAGSLTTLSAILAGFVFASVGVLLVSPPESKSEPPAASSRAIPLASTVYLLLALFVSLIATTFFYAVMAANQVETPDDAAKVSLLGVLASYAFWMSVVLMALSVVWLCEAYRANIAPGSDQDPTPTQFTPVFRMVLFAVSLCVAGTIIEARLQPSPPALRGEWQRHLWIAALTVGLLFLVPLLGSYIPHKDRDAPGRTLEQIATASLIYVIAVGIGFAVILLFVRGALSASVTNTLTLVPLVILSALFVWYEWNLPARARESPRSAPPHNRRG